jgi:rhodanese-related sulfurtransferase
MIPLIILGGLILLTLYTYTGDALISSEEAKTLIASGKIKKIVDVRTKMEWNAGHHPKAVHIPAGNINEKTTRGLPKKGILVYCNTGQRARHAAARLSRLGFEDVYYIAGHYSSLL